MAHASQTRALHNYRARLTERGLARFEVLGLEADRALIRSLARRLAEAGPEAASIRAELARTIATQTPPVGGILSALRRSPLAGVELDLTRARDAGRPLDL